MKHLPWILLPGMLCAANAQSPSTTSDAHKIPTIDGGVGSCFVSMTITGPDSKPVYAAKVNVHVEYGFGGFHHLDLEASTNVDGKLKFTGLPRRVKNAPLAFHASKDDLEANVPVDPATECHATRDVLLSKPAP